jgi:hypothetical protein
MVYYFIQNYFDSNYTMLGLKLLIGISFPFLLFSCISIEKSIKLNYDGSGEEKMTVNLHKDFFIDGNETELYWELSKTPPEKNAIGKNEGITDSSALNVLYNSIYYDTNNIVVQKYYFVLLPDSSRDFVIEYSFKDISKLREEFFRELLNDSTDVEGKVDITFWNKKDTAEFYYKLYSEERTGFIPGDTSLAFAELKLNSVFKDSKVRYNIFLEGSEIIDSNAEARNGNELSWEYTMGEFLLYPVEIRILFRK